MCFEISTVTLLLLLLIKFESIKCEWFEKEKNLQRKKNAIKWFCIFILNFDPYTIECPT